MNRQLLGITLSLGLLTAGAVHTDVVAFPIDITGSQKPAQISEPSQEPDSKGAVVKGRLLRGHYAPTADPLADTEVALIEVPKESEQSKKNKKKEKQLLFLPISFNTKTDDKGNFKFEAVTPGNYLLAATVTIGMATYMRNVKADGKDVIIEIRNEADVLDVTILVEKDDLRRITQVDSHQ